MADHPSMHLEPHTQTKLNACREILADLGSVVVAFSAGVDSTFLVALAAETLGGRNVLAAMGVSPSLAARERHQGRELARLIGIELVEVETGELSDPNYASNPANRCFYCKKDLFGRLANLAAERGFLAVASGANADDIGDFRPGLEAGRQMGVRNPLLEATLTKEEIRAASRASLASRVPYGQPLTAPRLSRIEKAEDILKDLGFRQCRVRDHDTLALIEVEAEDIYKAARLRRSIVSAFVALGYNYVALDLKGFRSGSMNEVLLGRTPRGPSGS